MKTLLEEKEKELMVTTSKLKETQASLAVMTEKSKKLEKDITELRSCSQVRWKNKSSCIRVLKVLHHEFKMKYLFPFVLQMKIIAWKKIIRDEHEALQLAFTSLEEKNMKLEKEHLELVSRWIALKNRVNIYWIWLRINYKLCHAFMTRCFFFLVFFLLGRRKA